MIRLFKKISAIALSGSMSFSASSAFAAGDAANGAKLFKANLCSVCHSIAKGSPTIVGPNLLGVVGRKAGSLAGYVYSPAMKAYGITWDEPAIAKYVMSPSTVIPNNKMVFAGIKQESDANDVAAYLATLK